MKFAKSVGSEIVHNIIVSLSIERVFSCASMQKKLQLYKSVVSKEGTPAPCPDGANCYSFLLVTIIGKKCWYPSPTDGHDPMNTYAIVIYLG